MSIPNGLQKAKCQFNLSGRLRDLNLVSKRRLLVFVLLIVIIKKNE